MGKSIRSKSKRASRALFRATVGAEAADEMMKKTQAKLKECIGVEGGLGNLKNMMMEDGDDSDDGGDQSDCAVGEGKKARVDYSKVKVLPKKTVVKASKKYAKVHVAGQSGAHRARLAISKSNKRGQTRRGLNIRKSKPTKKRGAKLAKF